LGRKRLGPDNPTIGIGKQTERPSVIRRKQIISDAQIRIRAQTKQTELSQANAQQQQQLQEQQDIEYKTRAEQEQQIKHLNQQEQQIKNDRELATATSTSKEQAQQLLQETKQQNFTVKQMTSELKKFHKMKDIPRENTYLRPMGLFTEDDIKSIVAKKVNHKNIIPPNAAIGKLLTTLVLKKEDITISPNVFDCSNYISLVNFEAAFCISSSNHLYYNRYEIPFTKLSDAFKESIKPDTLYCVYEDRNDNLFLANIKAYSESGVNHLLIYRPVLHKHYTNGMTGTEFKNYILSDDGRKSKYFTSGYRKGSKQTIRPSKDKRPREQVYNPDLMFYDGPVNDEIDSHIKFYIYKKSGSDNVFLFGNTFYNTLENIKIDKEEEEKKKKQQQKKTKKK